MSYAKLLLLREGYEVLAESFVKPSCPEKKGCCPNAAGDCLTHPSRHFKVLLKKDNWRREFVVKKNGVFLRLAWSGRLGVFYSFYAGYNTWDTRVTGALLIRNNYGRPLIKDCHYAKVIIGAWK